MLYRKRGKRPRGRPRKIVVCTFNKSLPEEYILRCQGKVINSFSPLQEPVPEAAKSSSSSSSSSSDSSSSSSSDSSSEDDDEDESDRKVKPAPRLRELHPVPQKKAQIVVAKQEPIKKKRGRKALPPEMRAMRQGKPPRKIIRPSVKDSASELRLNPIKKPLQPASFTYTSMGRSANRDPLGLHSRGAFSQSGAVKPSLSSMGPGRSLGPPSPSFSRPPQGKIAPDFKLSTSESGSGAGLDLKSSSSSSCKSSGVASLNLNSSKLSTNTSNSNQGAPQSVLGSPNGQKKHNIPTGQTPLQRLPSNKTAAAASFPSVKNPTNQTTNMQALNLQNANKPVQCGGMAGNGNMTGNNFRGTTVPTRKNLSGKEPGLQPAMASSGPQQPKKSQLGGDKIKAEDTNDLGPMTERLAKRPPNRVEKSPSLKLSAEIRETASKCERPSSKDGGKGKVLSEMSTGEEGSSSDSDQDSPFPANGQDLSIAVQASQDWKPTPSLIEHVFVTDVTANLVTVTVKESPTSVGFFSIRNY